ncbi:MAG TPA: peptide ABC transporter substrate-binding protein [Chloroflexota bacterium]|nr:peptide ABC transporter substrate-binding protein [Chloroflexota bacterium]
MRAIAWLALSVVATVVLLPTAGQVAAQQPQSQEARVNLLTQGEPDSLDPARASFAFASEGAIVRQVFEPLLRLDEQLTPQPAAAESYDVSPDGRLVTFHLRPDGRWSDGQPVTAAQFEFAWQRLLDPSRKSDYAAFFVSAGIDSVQTLDDLTFQVRLKQSFGPFPDLAALWVAVPVRPDIIAANPDGWAHDTTTYIGNGPFVASEWVHQDHITLTPSPTYAAHGGWPKATLSRLTVSMVSSGEADLAAFISGERDWVQVADADVNQVLNDATLAAQARQYNELTTFWVQLNNTRGALGNVTVRRALSKGLDRTALVRDLATGISVPTTSILPRGMPGYQASLGRELEFDPAGARSLLAQAALDSSHPLTFSYPRGQAFQRRAEYLQAQWKQNLGLDIQLATMETRAYQQAISEKNYDLAFGGWGADYPDPQDWFGTLFSCAGVFNVYNYCNPTFDQMVARADTATALDDRLQQYAQAQTILMQDVPVVPLFMRGRLVLIKPWVRSVDGGPLPITAQDDYPGSLFLDKAQILPH